MGAMAACQWETRATITVSTRERESEAPFTQQECIALTFFCCYIKHTQNGHSNRPNRLKKADTACQEPL